MKDVGSLTLLVGAAFAVRWMAGEIGPSNRHAASLMTLGLLLITAWLVGRLFERIKLPKVTGFLVLGLLTGPAVLGIVGKPQLADLNFVNDLAVSLIAFTAGGEIRLEWLKGQLKRVLILLGIDITVLTAVALALVFGVWGFVPFLRDEDGLTVTVIALLVGSVMIANSPTVVIAMISEYRASGPLSQTTLAITVCKDLVLIVMFACVMAVGRSALGDAGLSLGFLAAIGVQLFGSFAVGGLAGLIMKWYVSRVTTALPMFVIGAGMLIALIGEVHVSIAGSDVHLEPLLMALTAGLALANLWPERSEPLFRAIEETSLPVYCLFFALAGAKVDPSAFVTLWYLSLGLYVARLGAVWLGVTVGAHVAGWREPWARRLFTGLVPQAGVSFVLVTVIAAGFGELGWGRAVRDVLIGMIVLNELTGPVAFRYALFSSGEAHAEKERPQAA